MNDLNLYEQIPADEFPIRILKFKPPSHFFLHWHEHIEIHFIFEGSVKIQCQNKTYHLKKDDCFVINSSELHQGSGNDGYYGCILLPPQFLENKHIVFEHIVRDSKIIELIKKIFDEYDSFNYINSFAVKGYTYLLMMHLLKNHAKTGLDDNTYKSHIEKLDRIKLAIEYINENFTEQITTKSLAKMAHLSEGHFCHVFKDVTKKSAKEYINLLRLEKALSLLKSSSMTVTQISSCCGFNDANYFTRLFKKYTGKTPYSYKQNI